MDQQWRTQFKLINPDYFLLVDKIEGNASKKIDTLTTEQNLFFLRYSMVVLVN
jgi:hypothetical protein